MADAAMVSASLDAPAARVPEFFIVGHPKCGTTALYLMLRGHPQIYMPDIKEIRFFTPEMRSRFQKEGSGRRPDTLERYLALFAEAGPGQRVGEASPGYLRSPAAAARIAEVAPAARIIAILREPASFLRSFHLQSLHNHIETEKDLARAIALEPERRAGRRIPRYSHSPEALLYTDHVRYVEQLRRYHAVFAPEQVLTLIYDDFRRDNAAALARVLRFLEVDETAPVEAVETTRLDGVRSQRLHQMGRAMTVARRNPQAAGRLSRAANAIAPKALRSQAFRRLWRRVVFSAPAPPDERLMLELRRRFKPEVVELSDYLGRDLVSEWGYDSID
jgi:sulfotransferase family protein